MERACLMGALRLGGRFQFCASFHSEPVTPSFNLVQERENQRSSGNLQDRLFATLELDIHPKLVQSHSIGRHSHCDVGSRHASSARLTLIGEEENELKRSIMEGIAQRPIL